MSRFVRACLRRAVPHQARGMLQDCALYNRVQKHCVGAVRIEAAYKPSPNSKDSLLEYPVHRGMSVVPVYLILYDGVLVDFSLVLIAPVASNCLNIDKTLRFYDSRRWDPERILVENNDNLRLFPYGRRCPRERRRLLLRTALLGRSARCSLRQRRRPGEGTRQTAVSAARRSRGQGAGDRAQWAGGARPHIPVFIVSAHLATCPRIPAAQHPDKGEIRRGGIGADNPRREKIRFARRLRW